MAASLDALPVECVARVFEFACDDHQGGRDVALAEDLCVLARRYFDLGRTEVFRHRVVFPLDGIRRQIETLLRMPMASRRIRRLDAELGGERVRRALVAYEADRDLRQSRGDEDGEDEWLDDDGGFRRGFVDHWAPPATDAELLETTRLLATLVTVLSGPLDELQLTCYMEHLPLLAASREVAAAIRGGHICVTIEEGRIDTDRIEGGTLEATRAISTIAAQAAHVEVFIRDWDGDADVEIEEAAAVAVPMQAIRLGPCEAPDVLINALAHRMSDLKTVDDGVIGALVQLGEDDKRAFDYRDRIQACRADMYDPSIFPNLKHLACGEFLRPMRFALLPSMEALAWDAPQYPADLLATIRSLPPSSRLRVLSGPLLRRLSAEEAQAFMRRMPDEEAEALKVVDRARWGETNGGWLSRVSAEAQARIDQSLDSLKAECARRGIVLDCAVQP